ncbi:MAG: hypothetical protein IJ311_00215 [Elusimicrobiaceae bacterium]|nr:hypothetical protein [Elusimicrobiaceae bacterium]
MKRFLSFILHSLDPHCQSFLYFKWGFWSLLFCVGAVAWLFFHAQGSLTKGLLDNIFVYLPNYLTHEFSHRLWCSLRWQWWCYASGNGMETLIPLFLCFWALRLRGGRYLLPVLTYWLGTTLYGAGIYASDARASKMPLTSSDMMTNFAPGEIKGDWHYILEPLGLLEYDVIIGKILIFGGIFCLVIAVYSLWYYWTHQEQYLREWH